MSNHRHDTIKRRETTSGSTYQREHAGTRTMQLPDAYYSMAEQILA